MGKALKALFLFAVAASLLAPHAWSQDITPIILTVEVFRDGIASVEYTFSPDPTLARVNVTLFGEDYANLLATNQNGVLLDWSTTIGCVEVDSLGSEEITVSYTTHSLTNKTGATWSVTVDSPVTHIIIIPAGSALTGLTPPPIDITIVDNRAIITMPAGPSRVSYILEKMGTREQALVLLNEAKKAVTAAKLGGIVVDAAEEALTQAREAYDAGQYSRSEGFSIQASRLAQEATALAGEAETVIQEAEALMQSKQGKISRDALKAASELIAAAQSAYAAGEYGLALSSAEQAHTTLFEAEVTQSRDNTLLFAGATLVIMAGAGAYMLHRRGKTGVPDRPDEPPADVDLEALFRERRHLRTDDKAVLRYIQGKGGAFISEVRDHFGIPKSSAWRMIRRLEEEGLLRVSTLGRETYVQLREQEGQR